jgi:hypothetical protein
MHNAPLSQQYGYLPEKSTTMWTTPQTEEQRRYFSKHAPKRRVYGMIQTVLQGLHGFLAYAAWYAVFVWAFSKAPALLPFAPFLAVIMLAVLHILFRVTWQTFWYDRLDNDDRTDSSIFIPLAIMVVLLVTEKEGATMFLQAQVRPPETTDAAVVDQSHNAQKSGLEKEYQARRAEIADLYKTKERAATLPFDNRLAALQRRRADSEAARKAIASQAATIRRQRDAALEPIAAAKASDLERSLHDYESKSARAYDLAEGRRKEILSRNSAEQARFESEHAEAGTIAWLISAIMLGLIAALGYAQVRINVNSGILPRRNFTVLDAHGSVVERIGTAFSDAFNRRSLQLAVWLHRLLSPNEALQSFDGTVVARPGQYNTPKGIITEHNTPAPPSDGETLADAYFKVSGKVERIRGHVPGYTPSKQVLDRELNKALTMNGSYAAADWDDPTLQLPGKP